MSIEWILSQEKYKNSNLNILEDGFDFDYWIKNEASLEDLESQLAILDLLSSSLKSLEKKSLEKSDSSEKALQRIDILKQKIINRKTQMEK